MIRPAFDKIRLIGFLFIAVGAIAWVRLIWVLFDQSRLFVDVEMVLLPAGWGLLGGSEFWRRVSMFLVALFIVVVGAIPVLGFAVGPWLGAGFSGEALNPESPRDLVLLALYLLSWLVGLFWILWTVRRGYTRAPIEAADQDPDRTDQDPDRA